MRIAVRPRGPKRVVLAQQRGQEVLVGLVGGGRAQGQARGAARLLDAGADELREGPALRGLRCFGGAQGLGGGEGSVCVYGGGILDKLRRV